MTDGKERERQALTETQIHGCGQVKIRGIPFKYGERTVWAMDGQRGIRGKRRREGSSVHHGANKKAPCKR